MLNSFAPPFSLVAGYFCAGFLMLIAAVFAFLGADFDVLISFDTAAFFHLFFAGFVLSIIIGALYQLTSVVLEKPFFTLKFAYVNFALYLFGISGLVSGMLSQKVALLHAGGGALLLSLIYFGSTYLLSFFGARKFNFATISMCVGGIFLIIGAILGFVLVLYFAAGVGNLPFETLLCFHIYFVGGAMFFVILGVASVLLPMFALSHKVKFYLFKLAFVLFLCGGVVLIFSIKFGAIFIGFGAFCFMCDAIYALAKRLRKAYDYWNLNIFAGFLYLAISAVCLWFGMVKEAVFALTFGFFFAFIVAHIYKIVPFLIWYHYISPFVGKTKVPLLEQMADKRVAYVALLLNLICVLIAACGFVDIGVYLEIGALGFVVLNLVKFMSYVKFGSEL